MAKIDRAKDAQKMW